MVKILRINQFSAKVRTQNDIGKFINTYIGTGISEYSCIFVVDLIICL